MSKGMECERESKKILAHRLKWTRLQRGFTLQDLSIRADLAVGYINQLENGVKNNPTVQRVQALAKALHVSVGFLLGEVTVPGSHPFDWSNELARSFRLHVRSHRIDLGCRRMTVEERFALVVHFLEEQFSNPLGRLEIAYACGLTVRGLNDIVEHNCRVPAPVLERLSCLTGIALDFFGNGTLP